MFMKKVAAILTGAVVLALTLPMLASAQTSEKTADTTTPAAQEAAEKTEQPDGTKTPLDLQTEPAPESIPSNTPEAQRPPKTAEQGALALFVDGKDMTGGSALLNWPDLSQAAPTALLRAIGPDGAYVSPIFESSDADVIAVDASGMVTAVGYGVATVTATLDTQKAFLQISVGQEVQRVVIIGSDKVSHGRSIKLRAFDQDGNRIHVTWRSSSDKFASVSPDGVLTASRSAAGQTVDITALVGEASTVYSVKTIQID